MAKKKIKFTDYNFEVFLAFTNLFMFKLHIYFNSITEKARIFFSYFWLLNSQSYLRKGFYNWYLNLARRGHVPAILGSWIASHISEKVSKFDILTLLDGGGHVPVIFGSWIASYISEKVSKIDILTLLDGGGHVPVIFGSWIASHISEKVSKIDILTLLDGGMLQLFLALE